MTMIAASLDACLLTQSISKGHRCAAPAVARDENIFVAQHSGIGLRFMYRIASLFD
jgi:hypothetical protein